MKRILGVGTAALSGSLALVLPARGSAVADSATLFVSRAVEHADRTVTLPLHRGTSGGQDVWYVVLDASSSEAAATYGSNRSDKLANARGTAAVQRVSVHGGVIDFPATVDFTPERVLTPSSGGFPPAAAVPGAVGRPGYSPLVRLPDDTVLNAPQVANGTGRADKVVRLNTAGGTVTYRETEGFSLGRPVRYVSTEASDPVAATVEDVTYAPALGAAPFAGGDGTDSARASLVAFVNGRTGAGDPERQGLASAVLDGLDPLNDLAWTPSQGRYSPVWDVFPAVWTDAARAASADLRQTDVADVADLARAGLVTGPGGARFGPGGFVVDCPIISQR